MTRATRRINATRTSWVAQGAYCVLSLHLARQDLYYRPPLHLPLWLPILFIMSLLPNVCKRGVPVRTGALALRRAKPRTVAAAGAIRLSSTSPSVRPLPCRSNLILPYLNTDTDVSPMFNPQYITRAARLANSSHHKTPLPLRPRLAPCLSSCGVQAPTRPH